MNAQAHQASLCLNSQAHQVHMWAKDPCALLTTPLHLFISQGSTPGEHLPPSFKPPMKTMYRIHTSAILCLSVIVPA